MSLARTYLLESRFELTKLVRLPTYVIVTLGVPLMFYAFFGLLDPGTRIGAVSQPTYLLATYGTFGVMAACLFGFGVSVAIERGQGWLLVKRASPMPPLAYFFAKIVSSTTFAALIVMCLCALGAAFGGVRLAALGWIELVTALVFGALPMCAIGLAIGTFAGPNSAPGIVNLVYLPMSFLAGLWIPVAFLPPFAQHVAPWLPAYHLSQLALGAVGAGDHGSVLVHVLVLAAFATVAVSAAAFGFRRSEGVMHG
jgi:ABC-2 type transport system permease protein